MDTIIQYYIYHYIDTTTDTYYGKITKNELDLNLYDKWHLYDTFYCINPDKLPIPEGTKLFSLRIRNYFPYDISEYTLVYDIFSLNKEDDNVINFITYNRPVPNTKKLYLHELNGSIFPSFDKEPPSNSLDWTLNNVNPIFVMATKNTKFFCDNGRCIPTPVPENHFCNNKDDDIGISIDECLKKCNKTIGILDVINQKSSIEEFRNINVNISTFNLYIIYIIIIIISIYTIYLYINKR
jgi:hypothetical protein